MRLWPVALALVLVLPSCGGNPPPIPDDCQLFGCDPGQRCEVQDDGSYTCVEIPCTPGSCERKMDDPRFCSSGECVPCPTIPGAVWNTTIPAGEPTCSTPERPVKHWPPEEECPVLTAPCPDELPTPQCPRFTDRGGTDRCQADACDCFCLEEWIPCEQEDCGFPQRIPEGNFRITTNPGTHGSAVNRVMADLTGCAVGSSCPITFHPDVWMGMVCDELCGLGLNCGRHINTPPGASDQISVKQGSFCDGKRHENYQVYNYGGKKVRWAPSAAQDGWFVECKEPPQGKCPEPHPDMSRMKFNKHERGNHLDTTLTTLNQCQFCEDIGMGDIGGVPRCGCPVRPECGPGVPPDAICHERAACEAELCDQKWECNGQPVEGWRGNPAQTNCSGHYKTWCANAPNVVLEGDR